MKTPGGIGDQHIHPPRPRRLNPVEDDRGRVRRPLLGDDRHAVALTPGLQLLDGRRAECIARRQHHRQPFALQALGEFADGSGLADTVHAHHQNDIRTNFRRYDQGPAARRKDGVHIFLEGDQQGLRIAELLALHPRREIGEDTLCRRGTDIRRE